MVFVKCLFQRVFLNVLAVMVEIVLIANDVLVIVALPQLLANRRLQGIDSSGSRRFEGADDCTQRTRFRPLLVLHAFVVGARHASPLRLLTKFP